MTWRRGELWLDADVLWSREGAGAPALAAFAPAAVVGPVPAPGLLASRMRRAAWQKRRKTRRARATAIALSPALVVALAALRSGDPRSSITADDPPSLTFRLDPVALEAVERPARFGAAYGDAPVVPAPPPRKARHPSAARAATAPRIAWHHATSLGLPWSGTLVDGTQLPVEGRDWVTWDPVTDSVPNAPKRLYGNQRTIHAIVVVTAGYRASHPRAPRVVVGDISREGGGPMTDEHVSHQNGLDVDVYLPRRDGKLLAPTAPGQVNTRLAQDLVDRFVAAGAQMIFVGYGTGLHGPAGVVIPYPNHEFHMHVRFPPPGG